MSFSMRKTKRRFNPNSFKKRVYSEILDEMIQFHITAAALRSIDKVNYFVYFFSTYCALINIIMYHLFRFYAFPSTRLGVLTRIF